jgi:CelD/BcsL family acetyltransferase involved in cellulose biosynthesis
LGERGVFELPQQSEFLETVFVELHREGRAQLFITYIDDQPVAAEYLLIGQHSVLAYQSGLSPEHLDIGAGNISLMLAIRWAIESGYAAFDFLRGGEVYKSSWGAELRPAQDVCVFPKNLGGTIRQVLQDSKTWLQSLTSVS